MTYRILGEVTTIIFSSILALNIWQTFSLSDKKQRLFLYGTISSILTTGFNIISCYCIEHFQTVSFLFATAISTLYFSTLLIIPLVLSSYALEVSYTSSKIKKVIYYINGILYAIYILVVISNLTTGCLFRYDRTLGYVRGPLKNITYVLTICYATNTITIIIKNRRNIPRRLFFAFILYPIISTTIMVFQFIYPYIILTGVASFSALMLAYITIQSDMIDYDMITGLFTESKLTKTIIQRNTEGVLYIISIDNLASIQSYMDVTEFNHLLTNIGKQLSKYYQHKSFHIGTNRFAALSPNLNTTKIVAENIRTYFDELNENLYTKYTYPLDIYAAAIELPKGEKNYNNIVTILNSLLHRAKTDGNHSLYICNESVLIDLERKKLIAKILKRELTLQSEQFQVWFQPIYSISEKKFTYMEALSRLNNTELGNIPPQEFVQVAENKGFIENLGFIMFQKVCKFISNNKDVVQAVSINFSVYQMTSPNLIQNVLSTISRFGLSPSNIIMEITESIFIDNYELVLKNMKELAEKGIQFYLDDFGTGYSNLANVIGLPFTTIKIDRSLVLMMEENEQNSRLFSNLVETFKDAGFKILVEGVETQNQNFLVEKAGADYIQGYLYSRPLDSERCIEILKNQI